MFEVTERALITRINRKLAKECQAVRKTREGTRERQNIGEFYILDTSRNFVVDDKLMIICAGVIARLADEDAEARESNNLV